MDKNKQSIEQRQFVTLLYTVFDVTNCYTGIMHLIALGNESYILEDGDKVDKDFLQRLKVHSNTVNNFNINFLRSKAGSKYLGFANYNGDQKATLLYFWWMACNNKKLQMLCLVLSSL